MSDGDQGHRFARLLDGLEDAAKVPAKRRAVGIQSTVDELSTSAYEHGIRPAELSRLIHLITKPTHLDQASLGLLIRNLYPAAGVSVDDALTVVGCLGHGTLKPSLAIQSRMLRWLILVYHVLDEQSVLSQAYSVLFNLLDTAALRSELCHLLALITRRKHVRPFRIQALLGLSRQTGNDPSVIGLLRVYKNYYPEIIVGMATKGRASAFKHPDPQWRDQLDIIQASHLRQAKGEQAGPGNGFRVNHAFGTRRIGRAAAVPAVHTLHAQENSVTLEEVDSAAQFVQNLEKIELPSQLVAVLADPLLQKLMLLRPGGEAQARVDNWVSACAVDISTGEVADGLTMEIMVVIRDYVVSVKEMSPIVSSLLMKILEVWDGRDRRDVIFQTLSFLPLGSFHDLYGQTLALLERDVLDNTAASQLSLLGFYTALLRQWTIGLFSADDLPSQAKSALQGLLDHTNRLCQTLLQTAPTASTHLFILDFYEQVAALKAVPSLLRHIHLPNPPAVVVYTLLFSPSIAVLSRLCGILSSYKLAWEGIMGQAGRQLSQSEREHVNGFNGFLMDTCNCLWRGRAFTTADPNALGCQLPKPLVASLADYISSVDTDLALTSAFSLSYSPSLCLQSIFHVRALEDAELDKMDGDLQKRHAGPVTQSSLVALEAGGGIVLSWQEYRSGVLRHLEAQHITGIPDLMHNTMKQLMGSRA